jgi:glucose/mannose-6-phosphate isomerase
LEATTEALRRGARLVCLTAGGRLASLGVEAGVPVIPLPAVAWPRAAFGALAVAPLVVLGRMGLLDGVGHAVDGAVRQLAWRRDRIVSQLGTAGDEPAALARRIGRTIPLIHGGNALGAAAALRWKCQINENPKCPSFAATQPELCHNEVTGWGQHGDATRQLVTLVMLRHDFEHPQVGRRFAFVADIVDEVVAGIIEVRASGHGPLAQLFDLAMVGDFVSLHLAAREGIDPGPIPVLTDLKAALAAQ